MSIGMMFIIAGFSIIGYSLGRHDGFKRGWKIGMVEERTLMGLAIIKAFSETKREVLDKVAVEYDKLISEIEAKNK